MACAGRQCQFQSPNDLKAYARLFSSLPYIICMACNIGEWENKCYIEKLSLKNMVHTCISTTGLSPGRWLEYCL